MERWREIEIKTGVSSERNEPGGKKPPFFHIFLLIATLITTMLAGALQEGVDILRQPLLIYKGLPFSLTLMLILGTHEIGHYITSKRNGVKATLPYFIPAPSLLGTFGAFIKMESPIPDRRALLKIGVSGPLAGFIIALPATIIGLGLSEIKEPSQMKGGISLGSSILLSFLTKTILGVSDDSVDIVLHPIGFAGWIGLFVTALNLLPMGQLDGGHIVYSLFKRRHKILSLITFISLFPLAYFWQGWLFWIMAVLLFGLRHPILVDEITPLEDEDKILGIVAIIIFIITFIPVPFKI
ncbi:MAG: site-2 protease family protein [Nitrospinae bacterium]|nr:site-2 protease family protein [Nitrospinota bacterium]